MGSRKATAIFVLASLFFFGIPSGLCSESPSDTTSGNWVEVARFTGRVGYTTDYFTCEHVDWRIRWEYDPLSVLFWEGIDPLSVKVRQEGQFALTVSSITGVGSKDGINYIHDNAGRFYMTISTTFLESFTIIVEQNTESPQTYPSFEPSLNWTELTRFSGNTTEYPYYTQAFTCNTDDWRIAWNYEVRADDPGASGISFHVYETTAYSSYIHVTSHYGARLPIGGTTYFHDRPGTFIIKIDAKTPNFTIIIEQNLDTIPEFPHWLILPLFLAATLSTILIRKGFPIKNHKKNY